MTKADLVRTLIDQHGYGPLEAQEAVAIGDIPDGARNDQNRHH